MTTRPKTLPGLIPPGIVPIALLLTMFILGGGSQAGPLPHVLAQLAGIALLGTALPGTDWRRLYRDDPFAAWLLAGLAALFLVQIVPLPVGIWTQLPGRALYVRGDVLMFGQPPSRPLSLDPGETLAALVFLAPALAVWLHARRDPGFVGRLALVYLAFLAASLVLALAQLAAGPGQLRLYPTSHDGLPTGFFANRNHQSIAMACGIPLAAALHREHRAIGGLLSPRWTFAAMAIACAIGALLTGSRTGAALLLVSLAAGLALALSGRNGTARAETPVPLRPLVAAAIVLAAVLAVAVVTLKPGGALALVFSRSFVADDPRYAFWPVAAGMIRESLPWGIGFGNFRYAFEVAATPDMLRPLYINHAHNDWLEFALEAGLPGLALALAFLWWLARRWRQAWRANSARPLALAAGVVIALLLAHSTFDYPLRTIALSACFAGCAAALSSVRAGAGEPVGQPAAARARILAVLVSLVLAVTALDLSARYTAVRSGQTALAEALPAPGSRLLAEHALRLAQAGAPFGTVAGFATRAAAISPLVEPAFTAAALASPDKAQAADLLDHAWRLSRRDPLLLGVRLRLARAGHRPSEAFAAIDALYRLQFADPAAIRAFGGDLDQPAFMAQAVRVLASGAPWRGRFLADLVASPANRPLVVALAGRIQASPRPLTRDEMQPAIAALSYGPAPDPLAAFHLWQMLSPAADPLAWPAPTANHGSLPFDWSLADNARISGNGADVRLAYEGDASPATPLASKRLPLAAGHYRLAIASGNPGVRVAITCGGAQYRLANGDRLDLPADCPIVDVGVLGPGGDGWIGPLRLVPAG